MHNILLPAAISQGPLSLAGSPQEGSPLANAGDGQSGGFAQLLAVLGLQQALAQGSDGMQLQTPTQGLNPDLPQDLSQELMAQLNTLLEGDGNLEQMLQGTGELPPEITQLIDAKDFQSLVEDLGAFLGQRAAIPVQEQLGDKPPLPQDAGGEVSDSMPEDAGDAALAALSVERAGEEVGNEMADTEVDAVQLDAWVAQLPPNLQQALARLLESGNGLPQAAAQGAPAVPEVAVLSAPLRQLFANLLEGRPGGSGEAVSDLKATLRQALGNREGAEPPAGSTAAADSKPGVRGESPEIRSVATAQASLVEGEAVETLEQSPLRLSVLNLQQALGQNPQSPWQSPMTTASTVALQAGAPVISAGTASLSTPLIPTIMTPPGEAAWSQALGERVLWMAGRDIQRAELRLNPPQLGPVEIRLSLQNDQASVSFTAQHPFTREALEASLPRLREMLGEANLNLADVDVGQRDAGESRGNHWGGSDAGAGSGTMAEAVEVGQEPQPLARVQAGQGLVDYFA
jgi:hypothetical protein